MGDRLTEAQRRALTWISEREPVGTFSADGPALHFVRKLSRLGLIETAGTEAGFFGFIRYRVSPFGRAALAESEARDG